MTVRFSPEAARREMTPVDNLFFLTYMPEADGMFVKVYLYGLMQCYHPSLADDSIAESLGITEAQVRCAFVYWQARGLVRIVSDEPFLVEYKLVEQEALTRGTSVKYRTLVQSANALFAPRTLELREMKALYDCIELYGLEEGAVLELVSYCIEQKGKRVSSNYLLAVAQTWNEEGIVRAEDAQEYLNAYRIKKHGASEVLRRWNKRRKPTQDEMDLYDRWRTEWGFDEEGILAACADLVRMGTPTFSGLNDRLWELRTMGTTTETEIVALSEQESDDREFARLIFARLGKVEVPSRTDVYQLRMYRTEKGMAKEALLLAADTSASGERPWGLMKKLLADWAKEGVTTLEQAEASIAQSRKKAEKPRKRNRAVDGYRQTTITEADVRHMILDLNQDLDEEI